MDRALDSKSPLSESMVCLYTYNNERAEWTSESKDDIWYDARFIFDARHSSCFVYLWTKFIVGGKMVETTQLAPNEIHFFFGENEKDTLKFPLFLS